MKSIFSSLKVFLCTFLFVGFFFNVVQSGEGQIDISTLPVTISSPGSYILVKDIVFENIDENAITINSDNVTIDLGGHTIDGDDNTFLQVRGIISGANTENITLKNGRVVNWPRDGIDLSDSVNCHIENVKASGNGRYGVNTGMSSMVFKCTATDNDNAGIKAGENSQVTNCVSKSNVAHGIFLVEGLAAKNNCRGNEVNGIWAAYNSVIKDNVCSNNKMSGIGGYGAFIINNHCKGNLYGINPKRYSKVISNTCDDNTSKTDNGAGIHVEGSGNVIRGNHVTRNNTGIRSDSTVNYFADNTASGNDTDYSIASGNVEGSGDLANISF